jgi:hypothetical protein
VIVRRHSPRSLSRNCQVGDPISAYRLLSSLVERFPKGFSGARWVRALANATDLTRGQHPPYHLTSRHWHPKRLVDTTWLDHRRSIGDTHLLPFAEVLFIAAAMAGLTLLQLMPLRPCARGLLSS